MPGLCALWGPNPAPFAIGGWRVQRKRQAGPLQECCPVGTVGRARRCPRVLLWAPFHTQARCPLVGHAPAGPCLPRVWTDTVGLTSGASAWDTVWAGQNHVREWTLGWSAGTESQLCLFCDVTLGWLMAWGLGLLICVRGQCMHPTPVAGQIR